MNQYNNTHTIIITITITIRDANAITLSNITKANVGNAEMLDSVIMAAMAMMMAVGVMTMMMI